jgi:hypothetical protein
LLFFHFFYSFIRAYESLVHFDEERFVERKEVNVDDENDEEEDVEEV